MDQHENAADSDFGPPTGGAGRSAVHGQQFWTHLAAKLRGRYWLLATLMLGTAAIGGTAGWMHGTRQYRGEGIVLFTEDSPYIIGVLRVPPVQPERVLNTEVALILERPMLEAALATNTWRNLVEPDAPMTVEEFVRHLIVERAPFAQTVHIYFADANPRIAAAGARAVVEAYEADFHRRQLEIQSNDMAALQRQRGDLAAQQKAFDDQLDAIVLKYGSDNLEIIEDTKLQIWQGYEGRAGELNASLVLAGSSVSPGELIARLTPTQICIVDPRMARLLDTVDDLELKLQRYVGLGPNHPAVIDARAELSDARKRVDDYADNFRSVQLKMLNNEGLNGEQNSNATPGVVSALLHNVDNIREKEQKFEQMAAQVKGEWMELGRQKLEMDKIKGRRSEVAVQLAEVDHQIRAVSLQNQIKQSLSVISYGDTPAPFYKDNRVPFATLGALAAMCLPLIVLAKIALGDRRYRYSDEADAAEEGRPPLLGILPEIPEKVVDPEQVAVVAHCVHQIRVTLQIGHDPAKPSTYMVTSGRAGDGKTSLTVALGMSFASSGTRTLLIDGDMIGQALTNRMGATTKPGSVSGMFTGGLNGSVQTTAIPNLFLLPLPRDAANNPASLSPQSVRNLLKQARSHFEVILVDTGPVLGSIEASMISGAVDGVILAVSRGQDRSLVRRALRQLRASGANISGMVFNRAERRDFHRSVASISMRSVSVSKTPSTPRPLLIQDGDFARLGPMAACVASTSSPAETTHE